ncbi:MAG: RES family NAD+ phosphorylase [Steroidobacteraceae bacterium]
MLLEYFTDNQLQTWQAKSKTVQQYHYLWFFELEAQRAVHQQSLIAALQSVPPVDVELSGWGRAVAYKYSQTPLSCVGSLKWAGGRFNYGADIDPSRFEPFPCLYLAQDLETGLREMRGLVREDERGGLTAEELTLCATDSFTWVSVEGRARNIFDLTKVHNLEAFADILAGFKVSARVRAMEQKMRATPLRLIANATELSAVLMAENWREYPVLFDTPANSQTFASFLIQAGFEGALYSSTKSGKLNLAVFPRQLEHSDTVIRVKDPPSAASCVELSRHIYSSVE